MGANIFVNAEQGSQDNLLLSTDPEDYVSLDNESIETNYTWSIVRQPPVDDDGPAVTFRDNVTNTKSVQIRLIREGTYLIKLVTDHNLPTRSEQTVVLGVRQLKSRIRIPAAGEKAEVDSPLGWAKAVREIFLHVDRLCSDPGIIVGVAGGDLQAGDIVRPHGMSDIKAGLPGHERLPTIIKTTATNYYDLDETLGLLIGPVGSDDTIGAGDLVKVRVLGAAGNLEIKFADGEDPLPQPPEDLPSITGASVFASETGLILDLTQNPTNLRQIGHVLEISRKSPHVIGRYDASIWFDGSLKASRQAFTVVELVPSNPSVPGTGVEPAATGKGRLRVSTGKLQASQDGGDWVDFATPASTSAAGLMSGNDKQKLDGITAATSAPPVLQAGSSQVGTHTAYAREDHAHGHGNLSSDATQAHDNATSSAAGFMSGADKAKLDALGVAVLQAQHDTTGAQGVVDSLLFDLVAANVNSAMIEARFLARTDDNASFYGAHIVAVYKRTTSGAALVNQSLIYEYPVSSTFQAGLDVASYTPSGGSARDVVRASIGGSASGTVHWAMNWIVSVLP